MEASALSAPAGLGRRTTSVPLLRLRSDEQLVALFRAGNEDAFRVIHDRYRQRLFAYARQMLSGSRSDAEDAMQDVFLRAYRSLRVDSRPVSLRAWLYRVAHNRCVDQLRRPVPAPADVFDISRTPLLDPTVEVERREDLRRLIDDVRRLPEQQRSALLMRELEGLSYADLAGVLETSVPAVKSLLVRARIGLVEAIEARDTSCADVRHDLAESYDRGVRASGLARRHLRECDGCTSYRAQLKEIRAGFAALTPGVSPATILAKLFGLGGAGSGAAAGGAAAGGGGGAAAVGGGVAAVSVTKVAAIVGCAAALTGGAAVELPQIAAMKKASAAHRAHARAAASAAAMPASAATLRHAAAVRDSGPASVPTHAARARRDTYAAADGLTAPIEESPPFTGSPNATATPDANGTGGAQAPDEAEPADETSASADPVASPTEIVNKLLPGSSSADSGSGSSTSGSSSTSSSSSSQSDASASAASTEPSSGRNSTPPSGGSQSAGSGTSTS